jgi:flavin reductase (DIM6/NTAB) family NADH-FMN oxidoreductase RutF
MFYATAERDRTKLPHDPFKAIVAPRPIGWISTRALDGRINLAPYSFFNGFSSAPPIVGFSSEGWKDSASFAKESGEFVANLATHDLQGPMNETSAPFARGDNEFARAGLTMAESRLVAAPRVAESPAALECKVVEVVEIRSLSGALSGAVLTLGEVLSCRRALRHRPRAPARPLRLPGLRGSRESLRDGPPKRRRRYLIEPAEHEIAEKAHAKLTAGPSDAAGQAHIWRAARPKSAVSRLAQKSGAGTSVLVTLHSLRGGEE